MICSKCGAGYAYMNADLKAGKIAEPDKCWTCQPGNENWSPYLGKEKKADKPKFGEVTEKIKGKQSSFKDRKRDQDEDSY